jgi:hypothetical protein
MLNRTTWLLTRFSGWEWPSTWCNVFTSRPNLSASPASEDHINLDTVAHDVHHFSDSIFAPEGCSDAFKKFTDDTKRISQELLNMLEKLRVTNYCIS